MTIISCFGIHWRYDLVELDDHWIYGWEPAYDAWRKEPNDPEYIINSQRGIYILQNSLREVVYIGQAGSGDSRLGRRLWAHTKNRNRDRWTHFSWFGLDQPEEFTEPEDSAPSEELPPLNLEENISNSDARITLNTLEAVLISILEPPLNKRGGNWTNAKQLQQFSHYEDVSNQDLWKRHKKTRKKISELEKKIDRISSSIKTR